MSREIRSRREERGEDGFSTGASLVAIAASLLLVAVLVLLSAGSFSGGSSGGSTGSKSNLSILSSSSAEKQIQLCAEGRDSSYGDPPSPAQQSTCVRDLLGQVGGATGSMLPVGSPGSPSPGAP